jgi:hypothetical protein
MTSPNPFPIPKRNSSKRHGSDKLSLEAYDERVRRASKSLMLKGSFYSAYWKNSAAFNKLKRQRVSLKKNISFQSFKSKGGQDKQAWEQIEEVQELQIEESSIKILEDVAVNMDERLDERDPKMLEDGFWMKIFTSNPRGFDIKQASEGPRDPNIQHNFRESLLDIYNARHPDPLYDIVFWCPIERRYLEWVVAGHIFARAHGQKAMSVIFGDEAENELHSVNNGIIWSQSVEHRFEKGCLALVPLAKNSSTEAMLECLNRHPKKYQVKVLQPDYKLMKHPYSAPGDSVLKQWKDDDGQEVEFKSDHRPRSRYLYYTYCKQILVYSMTHTPKNSAETLRNELRNQYWGTRGRYIKARKLRVFISHMGHEYEELMNGAMEDEDEKEGLDDSTALLAASIEALATVEKSLEKDWESDSEGEIDD